jgi:hypothetical protein
MTLYGADRTVYVGDSLTLGNFANQDFTVLCESDNTWCGASAFCVCNDGGFSTFKY